MSKIDIKLSRSLTLNTGNYQSVKPTIDITVKDVDVSKVADIYLEMGYVLDGMMKNEILTCVSEVDKVNKGYKTYCDNVKENLSDIGISVENSLKEIDKYLK